MVRGWQELCAPNNHARIVTPTFVTIRNTPSVCKNIRLPSSLLLNLPGFDQHTSHFNDGYACGTTPVEREGFVGQKFKTCEAS
jgi:hypothetical protein